MEEARWEAASPDSEWLIPRFRAEFLHFTSKIVEHSRYLPVYRQDFTPPFFLAHLEIESLNLADERSGSKPFSESQI
jgi:hypothetical protein